MQSNNNNRDTVTKKGAKHKMKCVARRAQDAQL